MKNFLLVLTIVLTSSYTCFTNNEIVEAELTYNGQSDKAYYFTNKTSGKVIEFTVVTKKVISSFDLNDKKYVGTTFIVTYEIDRIEVSSSDNEIKQYKKRLILIDMKKKE